MEVKREYYIKGYPVKFHAPILCDIGSSYPTYKKRNGGIVYCAGYYRVHYPHGKTIIHCPTHKTLIKHQHEGPFKSKEQIEGK